MRKKRAKVKGEQVLELRWTVKRDIERNWGGRDIPKDLITQCAYFPRAPYWVFGVEYHLCEHCTFERPNPKCKHSHILIDTRIGKKSKVGVQFSTAID